MIVKKARQYFLGENGPRLNCAQAVIAACRELFQLPEEAINAHTGAGGGKAPNGYCGSLYAALYILEETRKDKLEECKNFFTTHTSALTCKEIRSRRKIPCVGCVEKATEFLVGVKNK